MALMTVSAHELELGDLIDGRAVRSIVVSGADDQVTVTCNAIGDRAGQYPPVVRIHFGVVEKVDIVRQTELELKRAADRAAIVERARVNNARARAERAADRAECLEAE